MAKENVDPKKIALQAIQEALNISSSGLPEFEKKMLLDVVEIFRAAGWSVTAAGGRRRFSPDLVATRVELGRERRYGVELKFKLDAITIREQRSRFQNWLQQVKQPFQDFDEFWLVGTEYVGEPKELAYIKEGNFRVFDLKELRAVVAPPRSKKSKSRTKIGKSVEANYKAIQVAIAALTLQIDGKIEVLADERPNSPEAIAARKSQISELEGMRAQLEAIRSAVTAYVNGHEKETVVVKTVSTFKEGLYGWWSKRHANICDNAAAGSLFLGSASLLHLLNADSAIAVAIAGTIFGGETVVKALKALPKKLI
ncbi:hypothetical protein ACQR1I_18180 [Bradyrhizobium sp. HKCCYLS2038]|uniref:hypothetical protein n=1 Tax=unclassified Bradyrhizobium TaxID=2631580 RepID=UPI003EB70F94